MHLQTIAENGEGSAAYTIQKSRFLAFATRIHNEAEAQNFIMQIKKQHYDARHNPSAYILGERGEKQKSNDDGEPGGTAGNPILEAIKNKHLTDVAVVVTRYFGGIKLGAGGLIRAYGNAAILGLESSPIVNRRIYTQLSVTLPYDMLATVEHYIREHSIRKNDTAYAADVTLHLLIEPVTIETIQRKLTDLTSAKATFDIGRTVPLEVPIDEG